MENSEKAEIISQIQGEVVEHVNFLRHEVHRAHFDRIEMVKKFTGIDYDALLKTHNHKAMDVWHQLVREWVDKNRKLLKKK